MSDEYKPEITENPYVPKILCEWIDDCDIEKEHKPQVQIIKLTDENAANYTSITSHVGWKKRVDFALNNLERSEVPDSNFVGSLLENTISTVILLASGCTPPEECLLRSILFLRNIRNEFGENPPNIASLFELLKSKASQEIRSTLESIERSDNKNLPRNLIITKVPKSLQK